jgi:hypothetical protein
MPLLEWWQWWSWCGKTDRSDGNNSTCTAGPRKKQRNLRCKVFFFFAILTLEVLVFVRNYVPSVVEAERDPSLPQELKKTNWQWGAPSNNALNSNTTKTATTTTTCGDDFVLLEDRDVVVPSKNNNNNNNNKIPNVLYQTGPSRCVPQDMYDDSISKWNRLNLSYRFYDDAAMDLLLYNKDTTQEEEDVYKEFPLLPLALKCIEHVKMPVMKADLWRYLVIWQNGGIFADLDAVPLEGFLAGDNDTATSTITQDHDAVFVPVRTAKSDVVSQWFFGASPRHPIMHYAMQTGINLLLKSNMALPVSTTGPNALYYATGSFLGGSGAWRHVPPGMYHGGQNDTTSTTSTINNNNKRSFVVLPRNVAKNLASTSKTESYEAMNMTHYFGKQKGFKFGGKMCLEWAGAVLVGNEEEEEEAVLYEGVKYSLKVRKV